MTLRIKEKKEKEKKEEPSLKTESYDQTINFTDKVWTITDNQQRNQIMNDNSCKAYFKYQYIEKEQFLLIDLLIMCDLAAVTLALSTYFFQTTMPVRRMDVIIEGLNDCRDWQEMPITIHSALSRLEYSYCREALAMDQCRFRNWDRTQKLRGRKFLIYDNFFGIHFLWGHPGCCCWRCFSDLKIFSSVSVQALAQELNFSAYLGLPVFMIPLKGPHNANLARLLLNHIHTGHHTSNVRHSFNRLRMHGQLS